ncbi:hypothetical protein F5B22DRAFT_640791 [Xylaria bambusicola]|uniref:uncharacterized protein n=1 Tax=Xylaria bambusicola TaxID=326684 RepID=UPI0020072BD1|nr:uncharacterized protein F5B22DRAFT_640791 [Xylaria bambusicola]KAI0527812.1 hypothetical protein F5B22DRAFT_640791 [Xylaria bambusicola]
MPRPRVSRPARTRPTQAANPSATAVTAPAPESASTVALQANAPSSDIYDVSDREKEKAATRRKSLRNGTSLRNSRTTSTEAIHQQKELEKTRQRRDEAMERLENITSTASSAKEEDVIPSTNDSVDASQGVVKATPPRRRPTDITGLDLDDSMFNDLDTTLDTVGHASAQRSAETSTLSVSQFRRRPRAGSFLSRDDGPIRPSSRAGPNTPAFSSTLNFGQFKRRAREPSILSTAQKPRPQRPEPERELEDEDEDEEDEEEDEDGIAEDGFAPEAESTPLRRSKRSSGGEALVQSTSSAKSRKRKSAEGHERRLRSSPFEVQDEIRQSIEQPASDEDSPLSLPQHAPSTPIPPMDPELMAPPLSSDSSESDEELWPPLQSIPKARTRQATSVLRRTPVQDDSASDMSSPPSLTHSPNYAHSSSPPPTRVAQPKRKASAPKPPRKLTTAELAGLLPRRRRRGTGDDPFNIDADESEPEVDISGLGAREDELGTLDVRMRRRPNTRVNTQNRATTRTRTPTRNKDKEASGPNKRISRTYGRLSDKENENENENEEEDEGENDSNSVADLAVESSQMLVERLGEELKTAVRKFQEVDKWELSFEERTRSSSPVDAR